MTDDTVSINSSIILKSIDYHSSPSQGSKEWTGDILKNLVPETCTNITRV